MVAIDIGYCACGFLGTALETQRELLTTFGRDLDDVWLVPGHGGVVRITVDGETVSDGGVDVSGVDTEAVGARLAEGRPGRR